MVQLVSDNDTSVWSSLWPWRVHVHVVGCVHVMPSRLGRGTSSSHQALLYVLLLR